MPDVTSCDWEDDVAGITAGDEAARLTDLMNRYEQPLCGFLHMMLGDRDVALECVQDTFVRAYENLKRGKPVNVQWLYKVARNRAVDELRHRKRIHSNVALLEDLPWLTDVVSEETRAVQRVLGRMSADEREVLYLHIFDRFKTAEIADMLGIGAGALRMRLVRARQHFRELWNSR